MNTTILTLIIIAITILLLVTEVFPPALTATMACLAMVFSGAAEASVVFSGFSDSNTIMLLSMLILGCALSKTGVLSFFSRKIVRVSRGKTGPFIFLYLLLMFCVSGFLKNATSFVTLMPCFMGIILAKSDDRTCFPQGLVFLACAAVFSGGLLSIAGTAPNVAGSAVVEELTGKSFAFFQFAPFALLFFVVDLSFIFIYRKFTYRMYQKNGVSAYALENTNAPDSADCKEKLSGKGIYCLIVFFLVMAGLFTEDLHGFSKSVVCLTGVVLCLAGKCITRKELAENIPWHILLLFATMLGLTEAFAESGAGELLADFMTGLFPAGANPYVLLFAFGLLMAILSQFMSATAAVQLLLPVAYALAIGQGLSFMPFALMVTMCASSLPVIPSASAVSVLAMDWGNYRFRDFFLLMFPMEVLHLLLLVFLIPVFYPF